MGAHTHVRDRVEAIVGGLALAGVKVLAKESVKIIVRSAAKTVAKGAAKEVVRSHAVVDVILLLSISTFTL